MGLVAKEPILSSPCWHMLLKLCALLVLPHACSDMLLAARMMNRQLTIKFRRASLANVEEQSDAPCNFACGFFFSDSLPH